jgi:TRAP-type mannitol/chloroaromatic compound transport system permease small subunit
MDGVLSGQEPGWVRAAAGAVGACDSVCRWTGYIVSWAALGTVLLCFGTVYLRYVMGDGMIWMQEAYVWTHVAVILLGAGYTMMTGGFVRVDVFYAKWDDRRRSRMDLLMTLLLFVPFMFIFTAGVWTFWTASYASDEASLNPGGLQDYWILKAMLLGFIVLVGLQALAFVLRGALVLAGYPQFALRHAGPGADAAH